MFNSESLNVAKLVLCASLCAIATMSASAGEAAAASKKNSASLVEKIVGSNLSRITLTQKASDRLDIRMGKTTLEGGVMSTPYASLIYDVKGNTWVYTSPQPLVFVRAPVLVDSIKGQIAILKEGPPPGTGVVVVGVAELYGAESGLK